MRSNECQQAFENIKFLLCLSPVLIAPQFDKTFMLQVDASQVGAGAVLLQEDSQGMARPVRFFSKKIQQLADELFSDRERSAGTCLGFAALCGVHWRGGNLLCTQITIR